MIDPADASLVANLSREKSPWSALEKAGHTVVEEEVGDDYARQCNLILWVGRGEPALRLLGEENG